jgi:DNA replication protein DnaC
MFLSKDQFEEEVNRWENRLVKSCPICKGEGAVPSPTGYKMCSCKEKSWRNSTLVSWGIPRKYLNEAWSWENCTPQEFVKRCKSYAENFTTNYFSGRGVYLYGSQGRGKSTMEALIAREVAMQINPDTKRHFKVAFAIYEDIVQLSHLSRQDKSAKYRLDTLINTPELLIIDNVGSETGLGSESKHSTRLLEFILRKRDNNGTPTIISSNFTPEELTKHYSDTVHDFVEQNCDLISVTGNNFRKRNDVQGILDEFAMGEDGDDW